jgi:hypothetical protein
MQAFAREGRRFGVGSDSNVLIDAAEELRLLEYGQRLPCAGATCWPGCCTSSTGRFCSKVHCTVAHRRWAWLLACRWAPVPIWSNWMPHTPRCRRDRMTHGLTAGCSPHVMARCDLVWRHGRQCVAEGRHLQREADHHRLRRRPEGRAG